MPEVKGDVVAEQTPALAALTELKTAIDTAANAAADAKAAAKADMEAKLEAAKAPMKASQDAVVTQAAGMESSIRTIAIRGGTP